MRVVSYGKKAEWRSGRRRWAGPGRDVRSPERSSRRGDERGVKGGVVVKAGWSV